MLNVGFPIQIIIYYNAQKCNFVNLFHFFINRCFYKINNCNDSEENLRPLKQIIQSMSIWGNQGNHVTIFLFHTLGNKGPRITKFEEVLYFMFEAIVDNWDRSFFSTLKNKSPEFPICSKGIYFMFFNNCRQYGTKNNFCNF